MKPRLKRETVLSTLLFSLYIFVFLLTELTINERGAKFFGTHTVSLYSGGLLCTSLGYVSFFISRKIAKAELARKLITAMTAILYMVCVFCFMLTSTPLLFTASALLSLFLLGYIGGFSHYTLSLFLFKKSYSGRIIGAAVALATILQFIVQNLLVVNATLIVCLLLSVAGILYLAIKPVKDWMFENPLPYASVPTATAKSFAMPVFIVAIMSLCFGLGDGLLTRLDAVGAVSLTSWVRLLYALGALIAGVVADFSRRRFLPLFTLCSLLLFSSMALFIEEQGSVACNFYICIMYIFSGFYVMYLTLTFLDLAPLADNTSLWAGMGRIVRGPFIALTALLSSSLQSIIGQKGIAVVGVCLSLAVLLLMLFDGQLNIHAEAVKKSMGRISDFALEYQLTPRETEILSMLLANDATNKDIAAELYLSVRVLERYITAIYEKTGVSKRIELMKLYYSKASIALDSEDLENIPTTAPPSLAERIEELAQRYKLTKRETQLLELLYERKTNESIAAELVISENTVKFHMKNLMKKLNASSRLEIREMLESE